MKNILVPIDFSELTERAVEQAAVLAQAFGSTIRLLHVAAPDPSIASSKRWPQEVRDELARELKVEHEEVKRLAEALLARDLEARSLLARGDVVEIILNVAEKTETDLIVLTAHRKGALADLMPRNVVKGLIRRARCPVLILPDLKGQPSGGEEKTPGEPGD